ncbi:acetylornithine aminotransferase [Mesonia hippocampi]|uniref:Acetylornithine aminotransferase n=1 Tax=Mesonia hippocampi TaxID=1628250 RepID=A0A840EUA8_9FLAO|nr:aminotransferase class III-fold pyridoxal phosphate-dependent enzyme [Mesonia hippocampi]MBB4119046.1 acetylornithine aminotransferase [Mesonia hippocampi]
MNKDFLNYQAQTSLQPLGMEVAKAKGSYLYNKEGKAYLDFVAGVSACGLGHCHPTIVKAIKNQLDLYMHVMVYGEYALAPAIEFSKLIAENTAIPTAKTYMVNSGTEAIEGALKLARRYTGRSEIIAAKNAYHGNTMGSLSLMSYEERKTPFLPLIPEIKHILFNNTDNLTSITENTAAVILETIQGGAGFILPQNNYLQKVKARCEEVGALLILDEIQPGFGRTGKLFSYLDFNVIPDILVIGKGMASGLPAGAFIAPAKIMDSLSNNPKMGHITTFGGNPVIAAAAKATLEELLNTNLMAESLQKETLFRNLLKHPYITEIRGKGLMLAVLVQSAEIANKLVLKAQEKGLILFWLLFEPKAVRITPPLTITEQEIEEGCNVILTCLNEIQNESVN